jgi:hypothetical protein
MSLPTKGVLFVFDGGARPKTSLEWATRTGRAWINYANESVTKIAYEGPAGSQFSIDTVGDSGTYVLTSHALPNNPPRVVGYTRHGEPGWNVLVLELDQPIAAVRARWAHHGRTIEYFEVAQYGVTGVWVLLGTRPCWQHTSIPPNELAEGGYLELIAIRYDGSEVPISGMPSWISTAGNPEPRGYVIEDVPWPTIEQPPAPKQQAAPRRRALVFAPIAVALWLALRRRLRVPLDHAA